MDRHLEGRRNSSLLVLSKCKVATVDSVLSHTPPWTSNIMGYHRVWIPKEVNIGCLGVWWMPKSMGYYRLWVVKYGLRQSRLYLFRYGKQFLKIAKVEIAGCPNQFCRISFEIFGLRFLSSTRPSFIIFSLHGVRATGSESRSATPNY